MSPRTRKHLAISVSVLAVLGIAFGLWRQEMPVEPTGNSTAPPSPSSSAGSTPTEAKALVLDRAVLRKSFVGSAVCAPCHQAQAAAHARSHHADALLLPTSDKVVGKLAETSFSTPLGHATHFSEKNGAVTVTTPDGDGRPVTLPIAYAAGISPLQQYVVATERGKLQTLGVSWDARSAADGGGRWFHLYGPRGIAPDDELFFTRAAQNFNHVCADCHATLVERRYDLATDRFDTRWAELSVGCEACHGPGAAHVEAAKAGSLRPGAAYAKTFTANLKRPAPWSPSASGSPTPRAQDGEQVEVCAPCHSRREPLHEGFVAGDPFLDAFEPELLRAGRYHADGQVEGEVYEWGSFLQSKMYASGVRCSDCHEPHSAELYAPGNALCVRCHAPARFDAPSHSHHTGDRAPRCVDCHMPPETFMQVDERRDHSIRIPRPDLSIEFGTPNACNGCHKKETPKWALEQLTRFGPSAARRPHFVEALGRDRKGTLDAPRALQALARDEAAPAIARATALSRLGHFPTKASLEALRTALASPDPLVVYGAVLGATALPLTQRAPLLVTVVEHPRRAVRAAVGRALTGLPFDQLPSPTKAALDRAFAAVEEGFAVSASRPETHIEKSSFELARGRADEAQAELETALRLAPCFAPAHLNLADLARARGDDSRSERELRAALRCAPQNAFAHHALGLWLVRTGKAREALTSLRKAVELAPTETRFEYVLAVAVADGGDLPGAVEILKAALEKSPNDRDVLQALAGYLQRLDRKEAALEAEQKLGTLLAD